MHKRHKFASYAYFYIVSKKWERFDDRLNLGYDYLALHEDISSNLSKGGRHCIIFFCEQSFKKRLN